MDALELLKTKYNLDYSQRQMPIILPTMGRWGGLIDLYIELGFTTGAEIGVANGMYSEALCKRMPGLHLYAVDAWRHYHEYRDTVSQTRMDQMYADTVQRTAGYNVTIIREFSVEASRLVPDGSLDFVFIDANHDFLHVTQDIAAWERKVRKGGIVSGHDWRRASGRDWQCHVKDVTLAWAYSHSIRPWFVAAHSKSPTWFWVKQ